jgi:hypothetical protein
MSLRSLVRRDYEEREVCGSDRHYRRWEEKEFNIDFEVSQALPVGLLRR